MADADSKTQESLVTESVGSPLAGVPTTASDDPGAMELTEQALKQVRSLRCTIIAANVYVHIRNCSSVGARVNAGAISAYGIAKSQSPPSSGVNMPRAHGLRS